MVKEPDISKGDQKIGADPEGDSLVALELRRQLREVSQRRSLLEAERRTLDDLRADYLAEGRTQRRSVALAQEVQDSLVHRKELQRGQAERLEQEAEEVKRELAFLEHQCTENDVHADELDRQISALEAEMRGTQDNLIATNTTVKMLGETVVRMKQKLKLKG